MNETFNIYCIFISLIIEVVDYSTILRVRINLFHDLYQYQLKLFEDAVHVIFKHSVLKNDTSWITEFEGH